MLLTVEAALEDWKNGTCHIQLRALLHAEEIKRILEECSFKVSGIKIYFGIFAAFKVRGIEEPTDDPRGRGFVCIKAMKT